MTDHSIRRIGLGAALAAGLAGAAFAGLSQLQLVECNNCARGPNDTEDVCGISDWCSQNETCSTVAYDRDGDGKLDVVVNACIRNQ